MSRVDGWCSTRLLGVVVLTSSELTVGSFRSFEGEPSRGKGEPGRFCSQRADCADRGDARASAAKRGGFRAFDCGSSFSC
mmetsp:Transcript_95391/g.218503  ORF Transcript_95391/g.218503 Transcript_95391/m.218503 type:complete len:80 (+) Transcript_95391:133-372(+)